jgi:hypothetical protein
MKKHIKYPKIEQFRNVVSAISRKVTYTGDDENGDPVFDHSIPKPIIFFQGTIKIHGTNAAICYNETDGLWVQSRTNIITPDSDNCGFAAFVEQNRHEFIWTMEANADWNDMNLSQQTICLFGEWAGEGIQKGVGITQLPKAFYLFDMFMSTDGGPGVWLKEKTTIIINKSLEKKVYNLSDIKLFDRYSVSVDFNMPQITQNKLIEITEQVEKECPVSKSLGVPNGIGEGVVWSTHYKGEVYRFKVKGEKHSNTKVKKLANVNVEKLGSIQEFVDYAVTKNRIDQAITEVFGGDEVDVKKMGDVIRWVVRDITAEESDTMNKNDLEPKDVNKYLSAKVRELFFMRVKSFQ